MHLNSIADSSHIAHTSKPSISRHYVKNCISLTTPWLMRLSFQFEPKCSSFLPCSAPIQIVCLQIVVKSKQIQQKKCSSLISKYQKSWAILSYRLKILIQNDSFYLANSIEQQKSVRFSSPKSCRSEQKSIRLLININGLIIERLNH